MLILAAPAYAEEDGYYESNEDGSTHTHYYYSDYSDEEYSFTEYCTWEDSYYDYLNYGQDGHYHYYTCPYCCGERADFEDCNWEFKYRDYTDWNDKKHKIDTTYTCTECNNDKSVITYKKHKYKWVRYGKNFWYECKYCEHGPKYNGYTLMDSNDSDNVTIKKNRTYKYYLSNYHKTKNKVKLIKRSKKRICTVKRKGKQLIIRGKKRGSCKVTVKMKSGAKYVLRIRVK